ncbi:unnamed protein product, partial [Rhizophagus irregularis]
QVDKLSTFKTESQFQNRIKYFWTESQDEMLILQCDVTTINAGELKSSSTSFNFMCGWDKITIETLLPQERNLSTLLNESLSDLILSSTYPFEVILKQELLWCLLCIKYPSNIKSVEHIKMLNEKICENPILVNFLKTRTLEWSVVRKPIAKWLYALEKYAVIHTIIFLYNKSLTTKGPAEFMMEGVEDYDETLIDDDAYLLEFWNKMLTIKI